MDVSGHLGRNFKPKRGGMAQSVGHLGRNFKPKRGGMAQSVEHTGNFYGNRMVAWLSW